jgi:hypothetical protein
MLESSYVAPERRLKINTGRFVLLAFLAAAPSSHADLTAQLIQNTVVDPNALTIVGTYGPSINGESFQQFPIISAGGWQYVAYYDGDRHVCLARRKLPAGPWEIIHFTDYLFKSNDAHNVVSMGICPKDGTIHLAFDHHVSPLHYRVSKKGVTLHPSDVKWTADLFGPITDTLDRKLDHFTYPNFVATPQGNLQLFYRYGTSGAGDRWVVDYDADSGTWRHGRQIDTGTGTFQDQIGRSTHRNGYENGYTYGPDGRLHSIWCWRESATGSANHDICYAWSDDHGFTWHNNAGQIVNSGDGQKIISFDSPGITAVPIDRTFSLMNQQTQAVDSKGRIHVTMWHRRDDMPYQNKPWDPASSAYFHYWRNDDGRWQRSMIPSPVGNRPKMFFDNRDNVYVVFMVNRDPARRQSDLYFLDGELRIAAATPASKWTDWRIIYRDPGHFMNEPLQDLPRLADDGILSIFVQDSAVRPRQSTPLRILDFRFN